VRASTEHAGSSLDPADRARLGRRARLLAATSVTYNVVEAAVAITAGLVAGSVALIGFGLDSVIEVSSGLVVLWQFAHRLPETRERRAQQLMSGAFGLLAVVISVESVRALATGAEPEASPVGIGLTLASLLVMPLLSRAQRRTGRALGSAAVVADGTQTALCAWLSAAVAVGLLLNATLGWTWADPVAGLVVAAVAAREAVQAWRGEGCCAPGIHAGHEDVDAPVADAGGGCTDGCCGPQPAALRTPPAVR
jgi:divalent metal cation (Fe/Co/Zn/Cd) transporter